MPRMNYSTHRMPPRPRKTAAENSLRALRLQTCRSLLKVTLESVKLPSPVHPRIERKFSAMIDAGNPFEPAELENAITEEQEMLSALNASGAIQGPGRMSNMYTSADQLEAAVDDLFGVQRDARSPTSSPPG